MDPLSFLNTKLKQIKSNIASKLQPNIPKIPLAGDVLNTVLYKAARPEASPAEAATYGAGTAGVSRLIQNLGPVRGIGPDFVVGMGRVGTLAVPNPLGETISDALAPFDVDEYLQAAAQMVHRGDIDPEIKERYKRVLEMYKPVGAALRQYGAGGPGL